MHINFLLSHRSVVPAPFDLLTPDFRLRLLQKSDEWDCCFDKFVTRACTAQPAPFEKLQIEMHWFNFEFNIKIYCNVLTYEAEEVSKSTVYSTN